MSLPNAQRLPGLLAAAITIASSSVHAAPNALCPDAVFLQLGDGNHTRTATVGVMWFVPWHADWAGGTLSSYVETSWGRWWIDEHGMSRSPWVSQLGVTPVLRWDLSQGTTPWFAEFGIGANVLLPAFHDNDRHFGTAFNFGDHVALGRVLGDRDELGLRVQHYSNGGIKQPNPGINFVQLRWVHRF
jgi:lipid A 3-O-deacylase